MKVCKIRGCNRSAFCKGFCRTCYDQQRARIFFSANEKLKPALREYAKNSPRGNMNAVLNDLVERGLVYDRVLARIWKEFPMTLDGKEKHLTEKL